MNVQFPSFQIADQKELRLSNVKARRFPIITKNRIRFIRWKWLRYIVAKEDGKMFRLVDLMSCDRGCIMIWKEDECPVRCPVSLHLLLLHIQDVMEKWVVFLARKMSS